MLNPNKILINSFVEALREGYSSTYGGLKSNYADIIAWVGSMGLENIANGNALYHNVEHTIYVTLVGQEILRGRHIREGGVSCEDWLHFMISLVCHDIGYIRGVCRQDSIPKNTFATGRDNETVALPSGATDAGLTPYHVDRGKLFVEERFGGHHLINAEVVKENIELTRFPVPSDSDHQDTIRYPGLVRAADLIGQLADPRYLQKIPSLFYEFEETGVNQHLGYHNPEDLRLNYPKFYWKTAYPYIQDAVRYLQLTQEGKQVLANLYSHVFEIEHESHPESFI
ncbi:MAG: metal-dependent phosphohydrolase [Cyanobacteria bacterium Co-bin13]|nr:metal-dependent phosphohydrolase [Cyanobacteria bacterium Co-bin13]